MGALANVWFLILALCFWTLLTSAEPLINGLRPNSCAALLEFPSESVDCAFCDNAGTKVNTEPFLLTTTSLATEELVINELIPTTSSAVSLGN